jgi:hypothetical protein
MKSVRSKWNNLTDEERATKYSWMRPDRPDGEVMADYFNGAWRANHA